MLLHETVLLPRLYVPEQDLDANAFVPSDHYTRVDVRPTSRHVRVYAGDRLVAESRHPLRLDETGLPTRWYLDPADVLVPLTPSATRTRCPYKGEASYWTAGDLVDAAWGYPDPLPESARIAGKLSFLHDDLRTVVE